MSAQHRDSAHHACVGAGTRPGASTRVVKARRTIEAHADLNIVLKEEVAPSMVDQHAVSLQHVGDWLVASG